MNDLTILYYTANKIHEFFQKNVIMSLLFTSPADANFVTVCQQDICVLDGPRNTRIVMGDIGASIYNVYRQILIGATAAKTPFVACCEDDTLYAASHFSYRPSFDTFAYDKARWVITRGLSADKKRRIAYFYWRQRHQMAMCIAPRDLLVETLEERFRRYPQPIAHDEAKRAGWGEPGRHEKNMRLTFRKMEYFEATEPSVTFNHNASLMGRRAIQVDDIIRDELPVWGTATELWNRIYGGGPGP